MRGCGAHRMDYLRDLGKLSFEVNVGSDATPIRGEIAFESDEVIKTTDEASVTVTLISATGGSV